MLRVAGEDEEEEKQKKMREDANGKERKSSRKSKWGDASSETPIIPGGVPATAPAEVAQNEENKEEQADDTTAVDGTDSAQKMERRGRFGRGTGIVGLGLG